MIRLINGLGAWRGRDNDAQVLPDPGITSLRKCNVLGRTHLKEKYEFSLGHNKFDICWFIALGCTL